MTMPIKVMKLLTGFVLFFAMTPVLVAHEVASNQVSMLQQSMYTLQYGDAEISPDGHQIAFIEHWISGKPGTLQSHDSLFIKADQHATAKLFVLTKSMDITGLAWFPDSTHLLVKVQTSDGLKLAIIDFATTTMRYLNGLPNSIGDFQLSPNGQLLAFKAWHANTASQYNPNTENGYNQLVYAKINVKAAKVLSVTPLTHAWQNVGGDRFTWSNDNKTLYFIQQSYNNDFQEDDARLMAVDVETGEQKQLRPGLHYYNYPYVSHDGAWLAYVSNEASPRGKHYNYQQLAAHRLFQICILHLKSGQHRCLHKKYDHYSLFLGWNKNDTVFYMDEDYRLTIRFIAIDRKDQHIHMIAPSVPAVMVNAVDSEHNQFVYATMWVDRPPALMLSTLQSYHPQQISTGKQPHFQLGKTTVYDWYGSNHAKLEGFLTLPENYKKGHPVPMIVAVHGGPDNHWWGSYIGMPHTMDTPICIGCLVSKGFAVFRPNEHGSTSYGPQFLLSNYRKLGVIDYRDIMLGVQSLEHAGIADPSRLGIWGWSYGGFMAQWANEKSRVFKAVIDGAGVADYPSLEGTAVYHSMTGYMGVPFWVNPKPWIAISPMYHVRSSYRPVLLQVGSVDSEVPKQSEELYFALKQAHKPVKFIIYHGQDHEFDDPNQLYQATKDADDYFSQQLLAKDRLMIVRDVS